MSLTQGSWVVSIENDARVLALPTSTRPYAVVVAECARKLLHYKSNAKAIAQIPSLLKVFATLAQHSGTITVEHSRAILGPGQVIDLTPYQLTITQGQWVISGEDYAQVVAFLDSKPTTMVDIAECPGYLPQRDHNALMITKLPEMIQAISRLTRLSTPAIVERGLLILEDGYSIDLRTLATPYA